MVVLFLLVASNAGPEVSAERVFFGHSAFAKDIVDTVASAKLQTVLPADGLYLSAGIYTQALGEDGDPASRVRAFARRMDQDADKLDAALFVFSFVDFTADTDVSALFGAYSAQMDLLTAAHANTNIVHATVPLTVVSTGYKAFFKHLIGRPAWGEAENAKRHAFNVLLRARYQDRAPIFDVADLESHQDTGKAVSFVMEHQRIPLLNGYYTRDGGHLSDAGREKLANGLVAFLRSLPKRR